MKFCSHIRQKVIKWFLQTTNIDIFCKNKQFFNNDISDECIFIDKATVFMQKLIICQWQNLSSVFCHQKIDKNAKMTDIRTKLLLHSMILH